MTIHELLALTGLTGSDEIPVWDAEASGEPTKKITAQNFAAAIKTLASLLGTGDVVNDLTIDDTTGNKPAGQHEVYQLNAYTKDIAGLQSGSNYISSIICAGFNTGSGNYVSVFIPVNTNNKTVSSVTASSTSAIFDVNGRSLFTSAPTITIEDTIKSGIRIEISYESARTPNIPANAYLVGVRINCT